MGADLGGLVHDRLSNFIFTCSQQFCLMASKERNGIEAVLIKLNNYVS